MNWLAHLLLSEPTPEFRLGNLLPDMVPLSSLSQMRPEFQRGIACHLRIDSFTDAHPLFRRSVARFEPPLRRYGGVLTDVFYDHILARHWDEFAPQPLPQFAAEVYASLELGWDEVPENVRYRLRHMCAENWLCAYAELDGIAYSLERLGARFRHPVELGAAVAVLEREHAGFYDDFAAFFPELVRDVAENSQRLASGFCATRPVSSRIE